MEDTKSKYAWVQYIIIPLIMVLYPMAQPYLDSMYGIEKVTQSELVEEVHNEVHSVVKNAEEIETIKIELTTYVEAFKDTLGTINGEIKVWNEARDKWRANRTIALRYNKEHKSFTYSHPDGNDYPVVGDDSTNKFYYIKDGVMYLIFSYKEL